MLLCRLQGEAVELHPGLKALSGAFQKKYADIRRPRKLEWVTQQGSVELDVELPDGSCKSMRVSQLHASLLMHFQDRGGCQCGRVGAHLVGLEHWGDGAWLWLR